MASPGNYRTGGVLMIGGGLVVLVACGHSVFRALVTGTTSGRLGAVHVRPEASYFVGVGAGAVGLVLGGLCIGLGWRWLRTSDR